MRQVGLASATALVVASMVGTGVFTTSGFLLAGLETRPRVLAAWLLGGCIAALGALSYGALARRHPLSGGEYLFLSRTLHPAVGCVAGWISFLAGFSAPLAAGALAFGEYSRAWWPAGSPRVAASVLLVAAAAVHSVSVRRGLWLHNAAVALKLATIALFVGVAVTRLQPDAVAPTEGNDAFPWSSFAVALIWVSYSYAGWNAAVYVGGEVREPERTVPRALLLGTAMVTALYLALNTVFLYAVEPGDLAGQVDVGVIAARALGGEGLAAWIGALVSVALVAHVSGMTIAGPRVYARMADDGYLPACLRSAGGPPRRSILLQTTAALVMLWLAAYERLLMYVGFTLSLSTAATVIGLMRVRAREGPDFHVPGWPWVPVLFLALTLWAVLFGVGQRPVESLYGLGVVALGLGVWWRRRAVRSAPRP